MYAKHIEVFNPDIHAPKSLTVIGLGAIGSRFALHAAELGAGPTCIIDFDKVESGNVANQAYSKLHVGMNKTVACGMICMAKSNIKAPIPMNQRIDGTIKIASEVIACCVDSMQSRIDVLASVSPITSLYLDARMTAKTLMVFAFNPQNKEDRKRYEQTFYPDSDVKEELGGCSYTQSVGVTAQFAATIMGIRMIQRLTHSRNQIFETWFDWNQNSYKEFS